MLCYYYFDFPIDIVIKVNVITNLLYKRNNY